MGKTAERDLAGERAKDTFVSKDDQQRPEELAEIDKIFKRYRDSDFGRKLYLIQNSIFGVDIELRACQIAKLRFFISLAIEQQPNKNPDENYRIKPLPNLETPLCCREYTKRFDYSRNKKYAKGGRYPTFAQENRGES